ncbi:MAG: hypothetical protein VCA40_07220 [Roseibacillus sp.]
MNSQKLIKPLYVVAAIYDAVLGIAFLFAGNSVFEQFMPEIEKPNHPGYIQFPAALLIVFALMYAAIARNPVRNRNLIPYGILLKVSYCSIILCHWTTLTASTWKLFCIFDIIFLVLFVYTWRATGKSVGAQT